MSKIIFAIVAFFSVSAWGIPQAPFNALEVRVIPGHGLLQDFDFNGIVALSNCSASIVHFSGQPKSSRAYVLTNGHCISRWGGFLRPGEVIYNQSNTRRMNAHISLNDTVRVQAQSLVYATMTSTDAALYRLNQTYSDLEEQGVFSFELSFEEPSVGLPIHVVSGYWRTGFSCSVDKIVYQLLEADWTFVDSVRYSESGCEVYGGTSGSPIIEAGERVVVGVNNTGNKSGQQCTMNNPCEVDENGEKTVIQGRGYGQQTYWFYSCLNESFEIDLDREGCRLPK